jgi:hypothetical protein
MRHFARRLVAYEARGNKFAKTKAPAAFHVCETFRPHLSTLMGNAGFRALLSRALALANQEAPWLRAVHVNPNGALTGLDDVEAQVAAGQLAEGGVLLLAELLGLLVAFIGEILTLRMVREVWPKLPFQDSDFCQRLARG